MPSFDSKKRLRFVIKLGDGKFGASGNDTITIEGFRSVVNIERAGADQMGAMKAKIYGVAQSDMNAITFLQWRQGSRQFNQVEVVAIDGDKESTVFFGNIINAWGDYQSPPNAFLDIQAGTWVKEMLKPADPRSYKGSVDVSSIISGIAQSMGRAFKNYGVTAKLRDVYLDSTDMAKIKRLCLQTDTLFTDDGQTIEIFPRGGSRSEEAKLLSKSTGMVGYPMPDGAGISVKCLFDPALVQMGRVKVESEVDIACGEWYIQSMQHMLESEKPGGAWFSVLRLMPNA